MLAWDVRYIVMCKGCLLSPAPTCAPARTEDKEGPSQPPPPPTPREMGGGKPALKYSPLPPPGNGRKWEKVVRSSFRSKLDRLKIGLSFAQPVFVGKVKLGYRKAWKAWLS
jgi:hypothetical protein